MATEDLFLKYFKDYLPQVAVLLKMASLADHLLASSLIGFQECDDIFRVRSGVPARDCLSKVLPVIAATTTKTELAEFLKAWDRFASCFDHFIAGGGVWPKAERSLLSAAAMGLVVIIRPDCCDEFRRKEASVLEAFMEMYDRKLQVSIHFADSARLLTPVKGFPVVLGQETDAAAVFSTAEEVMFSQGTARDVTAWLTGIPSREVGHVHSRGRCCVVLFRVSLPALLLFVKSLLRARVLSLSEAYGTVEGLEAADVAFYLRGLPLATRRLVRSQSRNQITCETPSRNAETTGGLGENVHSSTLEVYPANEYSGARLDDSESQATVMKELTEGSSDSLEKSVGDLIREKDVPSPEAEVEVSELLGTHPANDVEQLRSQSRDGFSSERSEQDVAVRLDGISDDDKRLRFARAMDTSLRKLPSETQPAKASAHVFFDCSHDNRSSTDKADGSLSASSPSGDLGRGKHPELPVAGSSQDGPTIYPEHISSMHWTEETVRKVQLSAVVQIQQKVESTVPAFVQPQGAKGKPEEPVISPNGATDQLVASEIPASEASEEEMAAYDDRGALPGLGHNLQKTHTKPASTSDAERGKGRSHDSNGREVAVAVSDVYPKVEDSQDGCVDDKSRGSKYNDNGDKPPATMALPLAVPDSQAGTALSGQERTVDDETDALPLRQKPGLCSTPCAEIGNNRDEKDCSGIDKFADSTLAAKTENCRSEAVEGASEGEYLPQTESHRDGTAAVVASHSGTGTQALSENQLWATTVQSNLKIIVNTVRISRVADQLLGTGLITETEYRHLLERNEPEIARFQQLLLDVLPFKGYLCYDLFCDCLLSVDEYRNVAIALRPSKPIKEMELTQLSFLFLPDASRSFPGSLCSVLQKSFCHMYKTTRKPQFIFCTGETKQPEMTDGSHFIVLSSRMTVSLALQGLPTKDDSSMKHKAISFGEELECQMTQNLSDSLLGQEVKVQVAKCYWLSADRSQLEIELEVTLAAFFCLFSCWDSDDEEMCFKRFLTDHFGSPTRATIAFAGLPLYTFWEERSRVAVERDLMTKETCQSWSSPQDAGLES